jgi:ATP-dependent helicase/nuclease subunit B
MSPRDWRAAERIAGQLAAVLGPLELGLAAEAGLSVPAATALLAAAVTEAATDNKGADGIESAGPAGTKLLGLFASLTEEGSGADGLILDGAEYPFFLAALMGDVSVPRPPRGDPRVHIWGTLEARLQSVDLLILGGLDEGAWPAVTRTDPFLSRAMRAEIGLPAPERRIGLAAHDFVEGMCVPRVIVTRSEKRAGTPTVESRWLQRLRALAGEEASAAMVQRGSRYIAMARGLDHVPQAEVRAVRRPQPRPPVAVRPRRLSITEIETLIRDPYAVYAKHILHLRPLDEIGVAPDGRLRGTLMHEALNRFTGEWHGPFDAAAEARLRQIGDEALESVAEFGDVHAVWSIRFAAIARWIVAWEAARDAAVAARHTEVAGKLDIAAPGGPFVLTGRADRIDRMADGTLAIYDFKTGTPQSERTVFAGLTPQMTLEAATARAGGFENIPAAGVSDLAWLSLGKAGRDEPYKSAVLRNQTADDLADRAHAMLTELIAAFDDEQTPYLSRARPLMERYLGDYEHLARVREWALVDSAEDIVMSGGPAP